MTEDNTQITIDLAGLREDGLFIMVPAYAGQCFAAFSRSMMQLAALCAVHGIPMDTFFIYNESLIPRARNYCVDEFLRRKFIYVDQEGNRIEKNFRFGMFIDTDIEFNAIDVLVMAHLQRTNDEYNIVCGPYARKTISYEKIKEAVDKGFADDDPNNLENFVGDYVFNSVDNNPISLAKPAEVMESGTGFMMFTRETILHVMNNNPELKYLPDHQRTTNFDGSREIYALFDTAIDPVTKRYLSEDYFFCLKNSTRILTEDGIKSIKEIVDSKYSGKVLSYNENTLKNEFKNVIGWSKVRNSNSRRGPLKNWVRLNTTGDNNTKAKLYCTEDHKIACVKDIFNPTEIEYVDAIDTKGRFVVKRIDKRDNNHRINPLYSQETLRFVIGTLLGDASISKNGQLNIPHCDKQLEYLELKMRLFGGKIHRRLQGKGSFNDSVFINILHTPVNEQLKILRDLMYIDGQKSVKNIIDLIDERSLAFWYFDDGHLNGKRGSSAELYTNGFSKEDVEILIDHIKSRFDIDSRLCLTKRLYKGKPKEYYIIKMDYINTHKFLQIVSKYAPACMRYKVEYPEVEEETKERSYWTNITTGKITNKIDIHGSTDGWVRGAKKPLKEEQPFDYDSIERINFGVALVKNIDSPKYDQGALYDIEVEDNHNFYANDTLVHNCKIARESGMKVWLIPWIELKHHGYFIYGGSIIKMAQAGLPATVDVTKIKKK